MRPLQHSIAEGIVRIVTVQGKQASFRNIWLEARRRGLLTWDRTLRRYLDLLLLAAVLKVKQKDVGSVYPQQLYSVASKMPRVWVGLRVLQQRGLNWQAPEDDLRPVEMDYEALVRARAINLRDRIVLGACLEDCLAFEAKKDIELRTGHLQLIAALLATTRMDLAYLLRRADSLGVGMLFRRLYLKIEATFTSLPIESDGRLFLQVRAQFLKIAREYAQKSVLKIVKKVGRSKRSLESSIELPEAEIVNVAAKQLGITG